MMGRASLLLLGAVTLGVVDASAQRANPPAPSRQAMLQAEDDRARGDAELAPLFQALASRDPAVVAQALRAIGRLERPSLIARILPFLADQRPQVRIAAAFAVGQIGKDSAAATAVAPLLFERLSDEQDTGVLAAVARAAGRIRYSGAERAVTARTRLLAIAARPLPPRDLVEVARALESLVRTNPNLPGATELSTRLRVMSTFVAADTESAVRIRRAGAAALARTARPDAETLSRLLSDGDPEVRRVAVSWAASDSTQRDPIRAALADPSGLVRIEAVRAWGRRYQAADCGPLIRALRDPAPYVSLLAIDLLAAPCPAGVDVVTVLAPLVDSLVARPTTRQFELISDWHRGAHALVTLARIDPSKIKTVLSRVGAAREWQVRMYAARAAEIVADGDQLLNLAADVNDNVREAAVAGLIKVRGHGLDSVYRAQLERPDYMLVIGAANALAGATDRPRTVQALATALNRLTRERKDTSRDPRMAILERIGELGSAADSGALVPLITDFDPAVAAKAAELLTGWTGSSRRAAPYLIPGPRLDQAAIDRLKGAKLRFTMAPSAGAGVFEILLYPDLAPATVARLVANARSGYYEGLTFHRIVPNFVIQGGSPRANEYNGDSRYLRDEVGPLSHERGTLGISTRGRDTGDSQIFINLIDNLRLDFDYTVFGRIVRGMDVVDSLLEGDTIEVVQVVESGS